MSQRDGLLKQCDCNAERWPKCPHGWHLAKQINGVRVARSLDKEARKRGLPVPRLRADAEALAAILVREIETGTPATPLPSPASISEGLTFDQAWPKFTGSVLAGNPSRNSDESRLRQFGNIEVDGRVGDMALATITEAVIEEAFADYADDKAEHTKRKVRRMVRRFFKWAVAKGHLATNPITDTTVMKVGKGTMRHRRVRDEEEANLIEAARETRNDAAGRLVAIIIAALDTCLRVGELLALQWSDILWDDGPNGRLHVRAVQVGAQKNREERWVPLTPRLVAWLQTLWAAAPTRQGWRATDYVFGDAVGGRVKSIRKAWVTCLLRAHNVLPAWAETALDAATRAQVKAIDLHFHDLRHEGALRWLAQGKKLNTIAVLLGHSDMNTLRIYLNITKQDAIEEAERIDVARAGEGAVENLWKSSGRGPDCSKTAVNAPTNVVAWRKKRMGLRRQVAVG